MRRFFVAAISGIAFVLALEGCLRTELPQSEIVSATVRKPNEHAAAIEASSATDMRPLHARDPLPALERDPFASLVPSLTPRVEPIVVATDPPRPTAPSVPFNFFGRVTRADGSQTVFLRRDSQLFEVVAGEILAGNYRVDKIGVDSVDVTYLPLDERQIVSIQ